MISKFRIAGGAARSIPPPLGQGGRKQFDFCSASQANVFCALLKSEARPLTASFATATDPGATGLDAAWSNPYKVADLLNASHLLTYKCIYSIGG